MSSQNPDLQALIEQENSLTLAKFSAKDAWHLGVLLQAKGDAIEAPIAISIVVGSTCLFSALLPGATADNMGWIKRKIALTSRFERSSYIIGLKFKAGDNMFERFGLDHHTYAAAGGAVPIRIEGTGVIGAVAVSGLPQEDDHRLVVEALSELKAWQASSDRTALMRGLGEVS